MSWPAAYNQGTFAKKQKKNSTTSSKLNGLAEQLSTLICPVAHAPALPLVAAPIFAAVAVLLSPLDVVQLPALEFINFALFDCRVTTSRPTWQSARRAAFKTMARISHLQGTGWRRRHGHGLQRRPGALPHLRLPRRASGKNQKGSKLIL